jgi:FolB domain-containing protein
MSDRLVIERLEFEGFCGLMEAERNKPQPIAVDLHLLLDLSKAASTDNVSDTVDYAQVTAEIIAIAQQEQFSLIETLAERIAQVILAKHSVQELDLWVRKLRPPVKSVQGSVGARITRQRVADSHDHQEAPAQWLLDHRHLLRAGRALDLACGEGRNALYLAKEGFQVEAWDRNKESLDALESKARSLGLRTIITRLVDLEQEPLIQTEAFDLIIVFYYLQRELIPLILKALAPGGILVYETFLIDNHERFDHPHRKEFCLGHNELLSLFSKLRILAYREGPLHPERGPFLASLVVERSL